MKKQTGTSENILEEKYIHDIAEICGLSEKVVRTVFKVYRLYLLHEIATADKKSNPEVIIELPCLCNMKLTPAKNKNSAYGLRISIPNYSMYKHKKYMQKAYYENKDYLIENIIKLLQDKMVDEVGDLDG